MIFDIQKLLPLLKGIGEINLDVEVGLGNG
jgi:hypothetical protein